ncbi:MAG: efflux RND transporter periplasmic adaptor subunit [Victivallaceae bacterium]|nr:efflux RND transporter periplasmic adaptor subunit [Victivallaceae bacterium]
MEGNIEPKKYANICARTNGALNNLLIKEGDLINAGTVLFQSDKVNLESEVEVAKRNVEVSKTSLKKAFIRLETEKLKFKKANIDLERSRRLIEKNVVSKDSFEHTELNWKGAIANIKSAKVGVEHAQALMKRFECSLQIAKKKLEDSIIKAPYRCVVTEIVKKVGGYAKSGDCVLKIEDPDNLEISILLNSNYYSDAKSGKTKVVIYTLSGEKVAESSISYRSPSVDPLTRTFEIKIDLPKDERFVSGMLCSVELIFSEKIAYGVPAEAIILRKGNKPVVFISSQGKAKAVEVKLGIMDNGYTEVTNLSKNASVVIEGQAFLNDGKSIKIIKNNK